MERILNSSIPAMWKFAFLMIVLFLSLIGIKIGSKETKEASDKTLEGLINNHNKLQAKLPSDEWETNEELIKVRKMIDEVTNKKVEAEKENTKSNFNLILLFFIIGLLLLLWVEGHR